MPAVTMFIDKFNKDVIIDEDHPLVAAQRAKEAQDAIPSSVKASKRGAKAEPADLLPAVEPPAA